MCSISSDSGSPVRVRIHRCCLCSFLTAQRQARTQEAQIGMQLHRHHCGHCRLQRRRTGSEDIGFGKQITKLQTQKHTKNIGQKEPSKQMWRRHTCARAPRTSAHTTAQRAQRVFLTLPEGPARSTQRRGRTCLAGTGRSGAEAAEARRRRQSAAARPDCGGALRRWWQWRVKWLAEQRTQRRGSALRRSSACSRRLQHAAAPVVAARARENCPATR